MVGQVTISSLSDNLLARIMRDDMLFKQRFCLPLVCRRWSRIIATDNYFWGSIKFGCTPTAGRRDNLRSFLLWVSLKRDRIYDCFCNINNASSLAAVAQLTALESLTLQASEEGSPVQVFLDLVVTMPKLRQLLLLHDENLWEEVVDLSSLRHLPHLSCLHLGPSIAVEGGASCIAANVSSRLTRLETNVSPHFWQELMPLSSLQHLECLTLESQIGKWVW